MQAAEVLESLEFYRIDEETCATLRGKKVLVLDAMDEVLDDFYGHISKFAITTEFFDDTAHMKKAKGLQLKHWGIIASGRFDGEYFDSVTRIGETHYRIGLDTKYYIGGYSYLISRVNERLAGILKPGRFSNAKSDDLSRLQAAITKAALFDMHIAIGVYFEAGERKRQETLQDLAATFSQSIGGIVNSVTDSAEKLHKASVTVSGATDETASQAVAVSAAAEEATANVQTVASATEELAASIQEISRQVAESHTMSEEAVRGTSQTNEKVQALAESAQKVGDIVSLISDIADQTNLLALNATIEAARAGEAGKGFAVVASEVKALANQTAKATADISQQIEMIQSATTESVDAIQQITETIEKLNTIAMAIASAVDQQNAATQEISRNVHEASQGTQSVSGNIVGVSKATEEAGGIAAQVLASADDLSSQSDLLQSEVNKFVETIKSA